MRRRNLYGLTALLCLAPLGIGPVVAAASKPNTILCMTDDQGWGDTSYSDLPERKTPNLDAMAAECIRFDRFSSAHPVCSPMRASSLSGRSPVRYFCMALGHEPLRRAQSPFSCPGRRAVDHEGERRDRSRQHQHRVGLSPLRWG